MDRHVVFSPYRPLYPRRSVPPAPGARRGARATPRSVDRRWTWLFALGALLALAMAPSPGRAQGLRSPTAGVTLIVTKADDAADGSRRASDVSVVNVRIPEADAFRGSVSLRLTDDAEPRSRLWIRDVTGRIARLSDRWLEIAPDAVLSFRVTGRPEGTAWRVHYRVGDGPETSLIVATPVSPVARR